MQDRDAEDSLREMRWSEVSSLQRDRLLEHTRLIAMQSGERLLHYLEDPDLKTLRDRADLEVERFIRERLHAFTPHWGIRVEEEPEHNFITGPDTPFWLIDPHDGTSTFLKGARGPSVSIALISEQEPVLGVIFAYGAPHGHGDLFTWVEGSAGVKRNGVLVTPQWSSEWSESILFVSNSADQIASAYQRSLTTPQGSARYRVAPGVAYRLALCAAGEGEVAISLAGPRDFDLAAGHALIRGVGGVMIDERGQPLRYTAAQSTRFGFAFAGSPQGTERSAQLDWSPTFQALRAPQSTPFLKTQEVQHCRDADLLDRAQGAWWGWHLGTVAGIDDPLKRSISAGDLELIQAARAHCRRLKGTETEQVSQQASLRVTDPKITLFVTHLRQALMRFQEAQKDEAQQEPYLIRHSASDVPRSALEGLQWGAQWGRQAISPRLISELLSRRYGAIDTWQPDGDRIIEQLLTCDPELHQLHAWRVGDQ